MRGRRVPGRAAADDHESNSHGRQATSPGDRASTGSSLGDQTGTVEERGALGLFDGTGGPLTSDTAFGQNRDGYGYWSRRSPTHSKCMPSGVRKLPPHANPCFRKICTVRQSMSGGAQPWHDPIVLVSTAWPQLWRDRKPTDESGVSRLNRGPKHPPAGSRRSS